jgi:hypothetical protein
MHSGSVSLHICTSLFRLGWRNCGKNTIKLGGPKAGRRTPPRLCRERAFKERARRRNPIAVLALEPHPQAARTLLEGALAALEDVAHAPPHLGVLNTTH